MIEFSFQMKHTPSRSQPVPMEANDFFPLLRSARSSDIFSSFFFFVSINPHENQSQVWMKNKLYVKSKALLSFVTLMFFSTLNITKNICDDDDDGSRR